MAETGKRPIHVNTGFELPKGRTGHPRPGQGGSQGLDKRINGIPIDDDEGDGYFGKTPKVC